MEVDQQVDAKSSQNGAEQPKTSSEQPNRLRDFKIARFIIVCGKFLIDCPVSEK